MTTPTGNGAAGDFLSALNVLLTRAGAGSIHDKIRANLGLGEAFGQQATAMETYAKTLQESGQYPASAYEPVIQGAGFLRAAATKMTESGTTIATIAKTPAGELGRQAPHRDELARA